MKLFFRTREQIVRTIGIPGALAFLIRMLAEPPYTSEKAVRIFATSLLPLLVLYLVLYSLNRMLIRRYDQSELNSERRSILEKLADAAVTTSAVPMEPEDLVKEEAWAMLKKYWGAK